ncbi:DUF418 domain-containing protein [Sphingomonas sp. ABOLD]|uniref:DUF418 domain-containing protein n=1 Tax=Sphingomonas trueperi TaxID=53317 RepID=A0A7X5Y057_9SPHN|nr:MULTISPECIES: DUF418 domain-containing protein [Sphingomonas]NJB97026.1 uncharacterized protein [Sphingomonas trueperi]RSV50798.1 DUF418 domain-containing protein [Sphingomonas sp. ABOLD]
MALEGVAQLAPVQGGARIDVLDILRGLAILGIFFMNIPFEGQTAVTMLLGPQIIGWTPLDRWSWTFVEVVLEGTQRGVLEILFGCGLMVLAARAMRPDGPVAVADLYWRRNLWLLGFGLLDIFVFLWTGDILHIYALAALFLFPFRLLGPRVLLALGSLFALGMAVTGASTYAERAALVAAVPVIEQKLAAHQPLTQDEQAKRKDWQTLLARRATDGEEVKKVREMEKQGHGGGFLAYAAMNIGFYVEFMLPELGLAIAEAFCMMLIGIALWKWRVVQGGRSTRFYAILMLCCYVPGMLARGIGAQEMLSPVPIVHTAWITEEPARILASIGHVALVNLIVRSGVGQAVLAPFKAVGRTAFSLYFLQQFIAIYILFAPWGPGLFGKLGWSGLYGVALAVLAFEVVLANLWLRTFAMGPMEWAWRSLAYVQRQPFRRPRPGAGDGVLAAA